MPNFGFNLLTVQYFRTIPEVSEEVNLTVALERSFGKVLIIVGFRAALKPRQRLRAAPHTGEFRIYLRRLGSSPPLSWRTRMIHDLLQPQHLLIILIVALFVFGPKKLPELGQGLGKGIRSFRDSMKNITEEPEKIETPPSNRTDTPK
jgi:sec-independent protein translocase protein TatA